MIDIDDVLLYSPTIESGVDFNEKHFDKMYGIIVDGSLTCSQRSFSQMVGRIRQIGDPKITVLYKNLVIDKDSKVLDTNTFYTFENVLEYYRHFETLNGKIIIKKVITNKTENVHTVTTEKTYEDVSLFDKIHVHNEVESLNKNHVAFMTVFKMIMNKKGSDIIYNLKKANEKQTASIKGETKKNLIEKMVNVDVDKYDLGELASKQAKSQLSEEEKVVLKLDKFKKTFKIDNKVKGDNLKQQLETYLGKESSLYKTEALFGYKKLPNFDVDTFNDGKERTRPPEMC